MIACCLIWQALILVYEKRLTDVVVEHWFGVRYGA